MAIVPIRWASRAHKIDRSLGARISLHFCFCPTFKCKSVTSVDLKWWQTGWNCCSRPKWPQIRFWGLWSNRSHFCFWPFSASFPSPRQQCNVGGGGDKKLVQKRRRVIFALSAPPPVLISRMHLPLPMPAFEVHTDGSVHFIYNGTKVSLLTMSHWMDFRSSFCWTSVLVVKKK